MKYYTNTQPTFQAWQLFKLVDVMTRMYTFGWRFVLRLKLVSTHNTSSYHEQLHKMNFLKRYRSHIHTKIYSQSSKNLFKTYFLLLLQLEELNNDPNVHGVIVQMPLDCVEKIDSDLITDSVCPEKDVDGCVCFTCFSSLKTKHWYFSQFKLNTLF